MELRSELQVELVEARQRLVDYRDVSFQTHRHTRCVGTRDSSPENNDFGGGNTRNAAEQHTDAALLLFETMGSDLHRHPSGYLTHRGKQRQAATPVGDCLISDSDSARSDQPLSQRFVRSQMQIREQNLSLTQQRHFSRLRLLDLNDQFRGAEHLFGAAEDV